MENTGHHIESQRKDTKVVGEIFSEDSSLELGVGVGGGGVIISNLKTFQKMPLH